MGFGREEHREIQRAGHEVGAHLGGIVGLDVEGGLGQGAAEARHPVAEIDRREIVLDAKAQGQRRRPEGLDRAPRLVPFMPQHPGVGFEPQPFGASGPCPRGSG